MRDWKYMRIEFGKHGGGFAMNERFVEDRVVDIVLDTMGDMTLNEVCQVGFREGLAEKISAPLLDFMSEQFEKRAEER